MKRHLKNTLYLLLSMIFFTACSGQGEPDTLSGEALITGIWDGGGYLWVFRPERKVDVFGVYEEKDNGYVAIEREYFNVPYNYDPEDQLLYTTLEGHTTAAEVLELTSKKMVLKEGKEIIDFTKVSDNTEGYAPESVSGKTLAIGVSEQNILFTSNSSCTIKLNWSAVFLGTQINRPPGCSYKKVDDTTAELTYVYGDITPLLSWVSIERVYRSTLTLHFTAANIGYVTGEMLEDGIEHDQHSGDESFSKIHDWDNIPFILR